MVTEATTCHFDNGHIYFTFYIYFDFKWEKMLYLF